MVQRLGLRWDVPISEMKFVFDKDTVEVPYISPLQLFPYILKNHRELLLGGFKTIHDGVDLLQGWWQVFKTPHPNHSVFASADENALGYTIPVYLYGDEGKGKRRGNTAIFTAETPFGLHTVKKARSEHRHTDCCKCHPQDRTKQRLGGVLTSKWKGNVGYATHNMKEHSYLSKFLLWVLPCQLYKQYDDLMALVVKQIALEFRQLFHEGVTVESRVWTFAVVGMKGDMKWHVALGGLTRHHGTKGTKRPLMMCWECHAGLPNLPYEDVSETPLWSTTLYQTRPFEVEPPLSAVPFDSVCGERMYKRDIFHITRLGVFRHYVASILVTIIKWGYFKIEPPPPEGNSADVQLQRSFGHCKLWCLTFGKTLALRSFSRRLLNWPNYHTFPWSNTKGSDTFILCQWLVDLLGQLVRQPLGDPSRRSMFEVMIEVGRAAVSFSQNLFDHHLVLSRPCAMFAVEQSTIFLRGYSWLAEQSMNRFGLR